MLRLLLLMCAASSHAASRKDRISSLAEPLENIVYLDAVEKADRVTIGVEPGSLAGAARGQ